MSTSKFDEFLNKVTSKVKSKETHGMIKKELSHHLIELSHSFHRRNFSKEESDEKAVQEMGNPFSLGENLNRVHRPKTDWVLLLLFGIIVAISFLPVSGIGLNYYTNSPYYFVSRQAIWLTIGIIVMVAFLFFDYRKLLKFWPYFYGAGFLLLLYTYLFGNMINGAIRHISIFGRIIDVTPLTLFLYFLAWAGIIFTINKFNSWKKQVLLLFLLWTPAFLYMMLPNFSLSIMYIFCIIVMFAFSSTNKKLVLRVLTINGIVGLTFFISLLMTSRGSSFFNRLFGYIHPNTDSGIWWIYSVLKNIYSEAGWFGNGFSDNSIIQTLPATFTDFVFPYLVYSLGWAFGIALSVILLLFIGRISRNAFKTKDHFGRLLVLGGAALISVPTLWNVLMGLRIVPIVEFSLPFISYGGSMLLFNSAILGIILSIYRRKDIVALTTVDLDRTKVN